jgi:NADPH:quinone reductase-like Zn-dependent oxidoreductase
MKAVLWTKFGPPETLKFTEVPKPIPKDNEVLVKVFATSVHRGDVRMRSLDIPYPWLAKTFARIYLAITLRRHPILGMEISGKVEAVGKDVSKFKVGDEVFAETLTSLFGGYAEYKCIPLKSAIAIKPSNMTFEETAVIPTGGITALGMVKNVGIQNDQKVLVYGASGSIGTFVVQICKSLGADVTGVCSTANADLIKELGASNVIDYTKEDFTKGAQKYDVVFDAVGILKKEQARKVLEQGGKFTSVYSDSDKVKKKDFQSLLDELKELCEQHKLKPTIDRTYTLDQIIEAHHYVDQGHKRGNVAVTVMSNRGEQ